MRINPINLNYSQRNNLKTRKNNLTNQTTFQGKHDAAKLFGQVAGGLGTAGAIGGTILMTGGIAIIPVLLYGGTCAAIGAAFGNYVDKNAPSDNNKNKHKNK